MQPANKTSADHAADAILAVNNIEVIYDRVILVLKGVSLHVAQGGIVALLGANGAGKTTTLKAISNLIRAERGEVTKGTIEFAGERIDRLAPNDLVRRGCIQVMEGRHCFGHLTIEENLLTGAFTRRDGHKAIAADLEVVYAYFPRLKQRRGALAGYTSGGEQQMCAIGRAMMSKPRMILLDEPSMGLAPQIVEEIFEICAVSTKRKMSPSCSPSRIQISRYAMRPMAIFSKAAASSSTVRPTNCATTRTSRISTSALPAATAKTFAM